MKIKYNPIAKTYKYYCPGCQQYHELDARWRFNGDFDAPTVRPIIERLTGHYAQQGWPKADDDVRCKAMITNGHIQYSNTSTHYLAGKLVPLPDIV